MPLLVIQIPSRPRLAAGSAPPGAASAGHAVEALNYVLSPDGLLVAAQGQALPAQLPKADSVVAVLADADVSFQRITLPKAPKVRLRAALMGVLEENLLDDEAVLHLAVEPQGMAGQPVWVAVMDKAWLQGELAALEKVGLSVDRVVPASWPGDAPQGHFFEAQPGAGGSTPIMLAFSDDRGSLLLSLSGSLARNLLPTMVAAPVRWTATPQVAAPAERWLGASVAVFGDGERALQAARSLWNLRQFDLATRHRGALALRDAARRLLGPTWRPVRIGVMALVLLHVVGLNVWSWQLQRRVDRLQAEQSELLRATFPTVRAVLDAPQQMRRETDLLRVSAGRIGEGDLEAVLATAASAWPQTQGPLQTLRYLPGQLTFAAPGWSEQQIAQFRERLSPAGWAVENAEGRLTLSRASKGTAG